MKEIFYRRPDISSITPAELLTVENCNDSSRIRTFLRLSRIATDDSIKQHLNGINSKDCDSFFRTKIVPQWQARSETIQFCSEYASHLHQKANNTTAELLDPKKFDLRTNPYALEDELNKINIEKSPIEDWVNNELNIEGIVRGQTISVLNSKCHFKDWLSEFKSLTRKVN